MKTHNTSTLYFALFVISGFTGLIYESIWSHYLKLYLGHAAYAQALVLTIFMGGMALGAYLIARLSITWTNLLVVYAIVEALIGCFGVAFHPLFQAVLSISYESIIPALGTPSLIHIFKWTTAILIILPQSILLGMTFPLMSNGIIRRFPNTPGRTLGMLYFTNSIGAAIGVLFSGFYLIKTVGLPGTVLTAGIINIILAIIVYGLSKDYIEKPQIAKKSLPVKLPHLILLAAFITGAASFIYEISWIRMLSMVLGASTHAFELMLSAFITGLAFGGLWIRHNIENLENPIRTSGYIQIIMGFMALISLPLYNYMFEFMGFLMSGFERNDTGYKLFNISSHIICLIIMLPTTFFAGMTLPLFTFIMLRQGCGEKSIGQIYASNTLGSIAGIIFAVFIGMPVLGLKGAILLGCSLDIILGLFLLARSSLPAKKPILAISTISCLTILSMLFVFDFDTWKMNSSVFRTGAVPTQSENSHILFHKDAKTSSISVIQYEKGIRSILTNGKPDAGIFTDSSGEISPDEITMIILAALPMAINPNTKLIANIGMGSGLTTHTLLTSPDVKKVDTIEIESAMVEGANHFRPRVERAFTDPRSKIHIEDAKTYFSTYRNKYDLIISEPSNPWVSGVSNLFTDEFYDHINNYLSDGGHFVQWIQGYEINLQLLFSVLKALRNNFSDFALYSASDIDLIIIASNNQAIGQPSAAVFNNDAMKNELASIGVHSIQDFKIRFIADRKLIDPLIDRYSPTSNSDYFPYLDLNATRIRYRQENIYELTKIRNNTVPVIDMLSPDIDIWKTANIDAQLPYTTVKIMTHQAQELIHFLQNQNETMTDNITLSKLKLMIMLANSCQSINYPMLWINDLNSLASLTIPYLSPNELQTIWDAITPKCNNGLNEDQLNWLQFIKALSQRNSKLIAVYSSTLFNQGDYWSTQQQRLQFTALITALVTLKEHQLSQLIWDQHIERLFKSEPIPLILLLLHSISIH